MADGQYEMRVYDNVTQLPLEGVIPVITGFYWRGVRQPMNVPLAATDETGWTGFSADTAYLYEVTISHPGYLTILDIVATTETMPPPIVDYYLLIDETEPPPNGEPPPVIPSAFPLLPLLLLLGIVAAILQWRSD